MASCMLTEEEDGGGRHTGCLRFLIFTQFLMNLKLMFSATDNLRDTKN